MATSGRPESGGSPHPGPGEAGPLRAAVVAEVSFGARSQVTSPGGVPRVAHLVLRGLSCRYRLLADGRRQILAIQVPGDLCDLGASVAGPAEHGLMTLTSCVLGEIPRARIGDLDGIDPGVRRALWRQMLRDQAIAREWIVGLGRRSSTERLAHLVCEISHRLREVGLGDGDVHALDLTQSELADVLGLSTVHVNRTLQRLRLNGLLASTRRGLRPVSLEALEDVAGFDPRYLELP